MHYAPVFNNMAGGEGDDLLDGTEGNDIIAGGDVIDVGAGSTNTLLANGSFENLQGGPARGRWRPRNSKFVDGGAGNDEIRGGADADVISGGSGNDRVDGGGGDDLFIAGGAGEDTIAGGEGNDRLRLSGSVADYEISRQDAKLILRDTTAGRDGVTVVSDIEEFQFLDGILDPDELEAVGQVR